MKRKRSNSKQSGSHKRPTKKRKSDTGTPNQDEAKQKFIYSNLQNLSPEEAQAILGEEGVQELFDNPRALLSRRGSIILPGPVTEQGQNIAIAHSERTRYMLEQRANFENARSREKSRGFQYKPAGYPPAFPGHKARVNRLTGTPTSGFKFEAREIGLSGRAGGEFDRGKMQSLRKRGWPGGRSEDTHHSEADYTHAYTPAAEDNSTITAHMMIGGNDMCKHCQEGTSAALAPQGSRQVVSYTGNQPFNSQGEWEKTTSQLLQAGRMGRAAAGNVFRARPEAMLRPADQLDHVQRAENIWTLRNRVNPFAKKKKDMKPRILDEHPEKHLPRRQPPKGGGGGGGSSTPFLSRRSPRLVKG